MTDQPTPQTEAGRDLVLSLPHLLDDVLAIEAQARTDDPMGFLQYKKGHADGEAQSRTETLDVAESIVAAQVRLTHKSVTNPMYPKPLCNHDGEEWPCLTELQVVEGLYLARRAEADG